MRSYFVGDNAGRGESCWGPPDTRGTFARDLQKCTELQLLKIILKASCAESSSLAEAIWDRGLFSAGIPSPEELCGVPGLDQDSAEVILAGVELGRRLFFPVGPRIESPREAYELLCDMSGWLKEHFRALYLDVRNRVLKDEVVSVGTLTASLVHPRELFRPALECNAAGVLVAHNHPSGDATPSSEDLTLTRRLKRAGDILGISIIDHLIIGRGEFVSLRQLGEL